MAVEVVMPRLGWGMEAGSLVEWIKKDGDTVHVGDVICTIEGDKAINEVESMDDGILRIPPDSPAVGAVVPVGTVLGYLVAPGETVPFALTSTPAHHIQQSEQTAAGASAPVAVATVQPSTSSPSVEHTNGRAELTISPRARRVASELGVDWTLLTGSGRTGRIVERDVRAAATQATTAPAVAHVPQVARVTPVARRVAREVGVDVQDLERTANGRRITRADVEIAAQTNAPVPPYESPVARPTAVPMAGIRRIIASRLSESMRTVVPVTLTTDADATELVRLREQTKADLAGTDAVVPTYNDFLTRLVALALLEHPQLNTSLDGETILQHDRVHVGLAVDTERGLLVPVIHDAVSKSVQRIATEAVDLIAAARTGRLTNDALHGATFSISNLGMYEIDAFTPIINLPECAILGVGRIVSRPVVTDEATGAIGVRKMMALSLTFDHRLVDGAPAARFLQRIKQFIERPTLWLIR